MNEITKDMVIKAQQNMNAAIEQCKEITLAYMNAQLTEKKLNKDVVRKVDGKVGIIKIEDRSPHYVAEYRYRFYPYTRNLDISKKASGYVKEDLSEFEPADIDDNAHT